MTMPAAPLALASWMKPTISPSPLVCLNTTSRPKRLAVARQSASTSARDEVPYFSGSRVPSRFRFGPLRTWMVVAIADPAAPNGGAEGEKVRFLIGGAAGEGKPAGTLTRRGRAFA